MWEVSGLRFAARLSFIFISAGSTASPPSEFPDDANESAGRRLDPPLKMLRQRTILKQSADHTT
jgi:hypothetical protein